MLDDEDPFGPADPLDADELMNVADRIEQLSPDAAEWVGRLFQECMRARMHEAELLSTLTETGDAGHNTFDSQLAQVALDAAEWLKTLWNVGYMGAGSFPSQPRSAFPLVELEDVLKSALFARIREGKRPLPFPPPTRHGLPWHNLVEGPETVHDVVAEMIHDEQEQVIGAIIEACPDWRVIETIIKDREYIVQHRGLGPFYRLLIAPAEAGQLPEPSTLHREPPRWSRRIRLQERGGVRSFMLEWPAEDGTVKSIALRAATWERAESEAGHWIVGKHPEMYGQVRFERIE